MAALARSCGAESGAPDRFAGIGENNSDGQKPARAEIAGNPCAATLSRNTQRPDKDTNRG
jgi:hypothetical protein